jgi:hypothetical protein
MKFSKITSVVAGLTVLAATLAPVQASALSQATMTLSGASQSNGTFAVTVYENTGSDTVTGAKVEMSFSQAVSNIAYDYSVGPFTAVTPSGAHNAYGTVTGTNPVARVSFTLANPGTVTASVNANSYLKHAGDTSVENFAITRGSADFTYTAPVTGGQGGGSNGGTSTGSTGSTSSNSSSNTSASNGTKVATNNTSANSASDNSSADSNKGETKDASTTAAKDDKKSDNSKKDDAAKTADKKSGKAWLWFLIAAIVAAVAYLATRKNLQARVEAAKAAEDAKNVEAAEVVAPAAATEKASQKNTSKKAKGNKKARSNRK